MNKKLILFRKCYDLFILVHDKQQKSLRGDYQVPSQTSQCLFTFTYSNWSIRSLVGLMNDSLHRSSWSIMITTITAYSHHYSCWNRGNYKTSGWLISSIVFTGSKHRCSYCNGNSYMKTDMALISKMSETAQFNTVQIYKRRICVKLVTLLATRMVLSSEI